MNFIWDGKLSELQDKVFTELLEGQIISDEDEKTLRRNVVVKIAEFFAPCNLVVRHYCLLDLLYDSGAQLSTRYENRIYKLCRKMCGLSRSRWFHVKWNDSLWLEGHSYWGYTRYILKVYGEHFSKNWVVDFIAKIDDNFRKTSYERAGVSYPSPFGDVWNSPLESYLQQPNDRASIGPVKLVIGKDSPMPPFYALKISTKPLGFNLHTDFVEKTYDLSSGFPIDRETGQSFKFYTGYKTKYPTKCDEIKAMLSIRRVISLFC